MNILTFSEEQIKFIKKHYNENDKDHGVAHIFQVLANANSILSKAGLTLSEYGKEMLTEAIIYHDIAVNIDRDKHHEIAAEMVKIDLRLAEKFDDKCIYTISKACAEHRASYKGEFTTIISELLSSADRGRPDDIEALHLRSFNYAVDKQNKPLVEAITHSVAHIKDKYGRNGYANFPNIYLNVYEKELNTLWDEIDSYTDEKLFSLLAKGVKNGN